MADVETKLRWLSARGNPVGAEELIERIEADLAGDPLVVLVGRREGQTMTKTQRSSTPERTDRYRGPVWAVAILIVILAGAGILAFTGDGNQVADTPPSSPPTTSSGLEVSNLADLEVIRAGVAALYAGDAEQAVALFELSDLDDDAIRDAAAYQQAIGGRLGVYCWGGDGGVFTCQTPYSNAMTDALNTHDGGDRSRVVVEDGVITEFTFPDHLGMNASMGAFLAMQGRLDGYETCTLPPFDPRCATIQQTNLDEWASWHETIDLADVVGFALASWYGGDCESARQLADVDPRACAGSAADPVNDTIRYESILGAEVSIQGCEQGLPTDSGFVTLTCGVSYSNGMNAAVESPAVVLIRDFDVHPGGGAVRTDDGDRPWYEADYPEDSGLRDSFRAFAESEDLQEEYTAGGCADARTEECANLIVANLDDWATWHRSNG